MPSSTRPLGTDGVLIPGANSLLREAEFMWSAYSSKGDLMNAELEVFGISVQEVARLLGVSVSHVYRLGATERRKFPRPRRVGRARRYDPREVREWFDAQVVEGNAVPTAVGKRRLRAA